jgi:hypothetical protein
MKKRQFFTISCRLIFAIFLLTGFFAINSISKTPPSLANISVDDWIQPYFEAWEYKGLEHLAGRGFFDNGYITTKPISIRRMSLLLDEAFKKIENGKKPDMLDTYYLKRLTELYMPEDYKIPTSLENTETRIGYRSGNFFHDMHYGPYISHRAGLGLTTFIDVWDPLESPGFFDTNSLKKSYNASEEFEFFASADISDKLVIAGKFKMRKFFGDKWDPANLSPEYASSSREFKETLISCEQGYITGNISILELEFGRDKLIWGNGYHSNLLISSNAPSFDLFKISLNWERVNIQSFTALIDPVTDTYLSGHRFEGRIFPWFNLAYTEAVYYAEQGMVWYYTNPFLPYFFIQWNTKDKDNLFMMFDGEFQFKGLRLYGSFLIDDYHWEHINLGPPQKTGYQFGLHWTNPFTLPSSDLRFEYTRVNPGTYAHFFDRNIYIYKDRHIGYYQGTDADDLFFEFSKMVYPGFTMFGQFTYERKGEMTVYDTPPHDWEQWIGLKFPTGIVQKGKIFGFGFYGMPLIWRIDCGFKGEYFTYENFKHIKGSTRDGIRLFTGVRINL